ncbi:hypothetical protein Gohar_016936 [Gossypium harknessii]|nr:hypothetical protein [Gossypium harknessii]
MVYISNRPKGEPINIQQVSPGLHVLSNAKLDSPWHKAQRLGKGFKQMLNRYGKNEVNVKEMVEKLMKDKVKADKSKLPGICALDMEFNLSSIFVEMDTPLGLYGTRSTAAMTVGAGGEVSFYDKYLEKGVWFERTVNYHIQKLK